MVSKEMQDKVSSLSEEMITIVNNIVFEYTKDLDDYMVKIDERLLKSAVPLSNLELETFILNLSSMLYFVSSAQETLGIKEDVCKAMRKEAYTSARELCHGTVADKDAAGILASQEEQLINDAYTRAYKKVKLRVDAGGEMLSSLKKVLSARISEMGLANSKI